MDATPKCAHCGASLTNISEWQTPFRVVINGDCLNKACTHYGSNQPIGTRPLPVKVVQS